MRIVPVIGKVYNRYTVVSEKIEISSDNKRMFNVQCSCGKVEFKRAGHLISGRCKSCKSCASKLTSNKFPPPINFRGIGSLSKTFYSSIKQGAKVRNIPFKISMEYIWNLFNMQQGKCALTGIDIELSRSIKNCNPDYAKITASLDRRDNGLGYVEDNVWWVHKTVNRLKNNYSVEELKYWSNLITFYDNPEPSLVNDVSVTKKVQRLTGEESTNNPDTSAQPL